MAEPPPAPETPQPQGTFIQRLHNLEEENKLLRKEVQDLKEWKSSLNSWLVETFGIIPNVNGQSNSIQKIESTPSTISKENILALPEILRHIFGYFTYSDLCAVRLVSQCWNKVVTEFCCNSFQISITTKNGTKKMKVLTDGFEHSPSPFIQKLENFSFGIRLENQQDESVCYKFFEVFGLQMKTLSLERSLRCEFPQRFIFSKSGEKLLKNIKTFNLRCSLTESNIQGVSLAFLQGVERMEIIATQNVSENGQLAFLSKFVQQDNKLKELTLNNHFCVGTFSGSLWKNLVMNSKSLEILHLDSEIPIVDQEYYSAFTAKGNSSKLSQLTIACMNARDLQPPVFFRFLRSHGCLQTLALEGMNTGLLEAIPQLDLLTTLELDLHLTETHLDQMETFLDRVETSFPKLLKLNIKYREGGDFVVSMPRIGQLEQTMSQQGRSMWVIPGCTETKTYYQ